MTDFKDAKNPDDEIDAGERSAPLDRREFGKLLAAGVGGLALGMSGCATSANQARCSNNRIGTSNSPDVIVIGAGLSGLIAALTLQKGGKSVILLEAKDYVGGRMCLEKTTYTTPAGYTLDMGGQWVGPTQRDMQRLAIELGIGYFLNYECGWSIEQWQDRRRGFDGSVAALLQGECTDVHLPKPPTPKACTPAPFPSCAKETKDEKEDRVLMANVWGNLMAIAEKIDPKAPWMYDKDKDPKDKLDDKTFAWWLGEQLKGAKDPNAYANWLSAFQARTGGAGGFEPDQVSMLHMAWTQKVGAQTEEPETWQLKGGAGQIPERLETTINNWEGAREHSIFHPIRLNEAVTLVQLQDDGCFVVTTHSTKGQGVTCAPSGENLPSGQKYCCRDIIVAIPPPLRQKITFEPITRDYDGELFLIAVWQGLNFGKNSHMGSMSKVHLVYESAFWRHSCLSGSVVGSLEDTAGWVGPTYCEFIADSSPPEGIPGVLTAFIAGERNTKIEDWSPERVKEQVLKEVCEYFKNKVPNSEDFKKFGPSLPGKPPEFFYRNWNTQPYTCGAFTSYLPVNTWTEYGEEGWRKPVEVKAFDPSKKIGRICWAGTETSDSWPGYYDGAIRAGKSAAADILAGILGVKRDIYDPKKPKDPRFPEFSTEEGACLPPAGK